MTFGYFWCVYSFRYIAGEKHPQAPCGLPRWRLKDIFGALGPSWNRWQVSYGQLRLTTLWLCQNSYGKWP